MPDLHGWITRQVDRVETEACGHPQLPRMESQADFARYVRDYDSVRTAAVLRRCEADRRILARHRLNPDAYWADAAMCHGCGDEGEMADPRTENLNDCPELLDLAHAHGLTNAILAGLDRPQEGERPEPSGRSLIPDVLAEAMYGPIIRMAMCEVPAALRGPNWKGAADA